MKTLKNQLSAKTSTTIALILTLTLTMLMTGLPLVKAQGYIEYKTYADVMTSPASLVGAGQQMLVNYRIDKLYPIQTNLTGPFWIFTVKITQPDGTSILKTNLPDDSTSGGWFYFT